MISRKGQDRVFGWLMGLSLAGVVAALIAIAGCVAVRGAAGFTWRMLIETPKGGYYLGGEGGIANAIVGSLCLAVGATLLSALFSLPASLALQREYASPRLSRAARLLFDTLAGVPSIVWGALGFVVMSWLGMRASLLAGMATLAVLIFPIMTCAMAEAVKAVPPGVKEAARGLGASRTQTSWLVVARQALPGLLAAVLLAFGRGIGDAASVLFTAGYTDHIPRSLLDPVASLPLAVFFQIGTPYPEAQARGYASALVLLVIVLLVSFSSRLAGRRLSRHVLR
ncbi:MAG TPA: ABC transporter permease subunit [Candidatus Brocadiia bacterium]|nr:ABC transporter permease subunit [Candidatus Brocadiia bacterium]